MDHFCFLVNCSSCTLFFLENEQQIRGKGNEEESQNPHQTLIIINIAKPMLCHSLQCCHCLFFVQNDKMWPHIWMQGSGGQRIKLVFEASIKGMMNTSASQKSVLHLQCSHCSSVSHLQCSHCSSVLHQQCSQCGFVHDVISPQVF